MVNHKHRHSTIDGLLAWSGTFRCAEIFSNYLPYFEVGTMLVGANAAVFQDDALGRAKKSIRKRAFCPVGHCSAAHGSVRRAWCGIALGYAVSPGLCLPVETAVRGAASCARLQWVGSQR